MFRIVCRLGSAGIMWMVKPSTGKKPSDRNASNTANTRSLSSMGKGGENTADSWPQFAPATFQPPTS